MFQTTNQKLSNLRPIASACRAMSSLVSGVWPAPWPKCKESRAVQKISALPRFFLHNCVGNQRFQTLSMYKVGHFHGIPWSIFMLVCYLSERFNL